MAMVRPCVIVQVLLARARVRVCMVSAVSQGLVSLLGVQKIGRYEVLSHLASGGMGQVYLARSTGLGGFERQVVVKTLDLSITDDDEAFVTMFLDEARLVGALHHQYIAPVYEVGCDDEGRYYLVMDYVHGETAEAVYRTSKDRSVPVPLPFALTVVSCVASALDYAHNLCAGDGTPLDIVHRDISLSNVMVGYDGAVKLIDFGIAKAANRATKTQVGTLKGKIGYLAPEQILRKAVDHRADIFALGIVLYELTCGKRAFRDSSDLLTLERITNGEVEPPTSVVPSYPPELERIVLKALQVDPDERFQDAATMGRELEALAARMSLRLGHAAVIEVMTSLFGDQRRVRRRIARGSQDPTTDPSVEVLSADDEDEKTPLVDLGVDADVDPHAAESRGRAARPTTPNGDRSRRDVAAGSPGGGIDLPPDSVAMSNADRALDTESQHALIPLEDRPTSLAERAIDLARLVERPTPQQLGADLGGLVERPTPPQRLSSPRVRERPTPQQRLSSPGIVERPMPQERAPSSRLTASSAPQPRPSSSRLGSSPPPPPVPVAERKTLPLAPPGAPRARLAESTPSRAQPIADDNNDNVVPRTPTGPQLPVVIFRQPMLDDVADAPTHIVGMGPEREDPTDVSSPMVIPPPSLMVGAERIPRTRSLPSTVANVVVSRVKPALSEPARTWFLLCGVFALAVIAAIVIALL